MIIPSFLPVLLKEKNLGFGGNASDIFHSCGGGHDGVVSGWHWIAVMLTFLSLN